MAKYPKFIQDSESSCGVYCIKMILNYYHYDDEVKNIKKRCRLTQDGVTVYGMLQCLQQYHIDAKAYHCEFKKLLDDMQVPAIIHLNRNGLLHYVVLYKVHDQYFLIGDPAKGIVKMNYEQMHEEFTGVILIIHHVGRPIDEISSYSFRSFICQHFKMYYPMIIKIIIKTLIISILSILFSFYYRLLIDSFDNMSFLYVVLISFSFIIVYLIKSYLTYYRNIHTIQLKKILDQDYVVKTMKNMVYLDQEYFQFHKEGRIIVRANHLFELSDYFIKLYHTLFIDGILMLVVFLTIAWIHFYLFLFVIVFIIIILGLLLYSSQQIKVQNKRIIEKQEIVNQGLIEYHQNIFQTIQFKLKRMMKNKIHYLYDELIECQFNKESLLNHLNVMVDMIIQLMIMIILVLAIFLYKDKQLTLGVVMMVYMLVSYLIEPIIDLSSFIMMNDEIKVIFEKYKEMKPDKIVRKRKIKKIRTIQIENLTYSYGYSKPIFEHLNLTIEHSFLLNGSTGSGKSTLLKLISGQLKVVKGKIMINGYDIHDLDLNSLYHKMKYLDKNPHFYQESLQFNLLLENQQNQDKMIEMLHYFMLDDLIEKLEMHLDVNGGFLSSGQQELVMIIRTLLIKCDVLILDEAFSHVDQKRVSLLLSYLDKLNCIVIIVSHQINIVNNNYECVIIDSGKIVGGK